MFPIWDHIFSKYYYGNDIVTEIGISKSKFGESMFKQITNDIGLSIKLAFKLIFLHGVKGKNQSE